MVSVEAAIENAKALLIVTEHTDTIAVVKKMDFTKSEIEVIVDGRNCLEGDHIKSKGILYKGIGR